ncbi:S-phase kinase-associated protein 2-like [Thalassophryne amazonica]|uniref:S-phase kinase-associated protein 2-like n=1 Tax=Thalassophryne amazonica TaxID=390379 RepID=UPI0014710D0C|nr:S-phase kinase-associated protein 2-like [Thalassophryne amazonica]
MCCSDSVLLMADCFTVLAQLKHLLHLSLSRCYHIHAAAFSGFEQTFPTVRLLDVFGLVHDSQLPSLKNEIPRISINSKPFSGVARPTPALCPKHHERTMWGRSCRLRFKM